ncbi:hypothetical protein [Bacillus benzoevorans]|uniref:Uncharacterized protein n=1 Tax=Bacillus benzoevorans TaxID=1456 RepID=A0A7X0HTS5_9BACI|nr:hypothetical protein [Bacillus benzoevorans]MBB6446722.1 hypothetical protein [Bacillus benzoevorans]
MLNKVQRNFRRQMKNMNIEEDNYHRIYRSPRNTAFRKSPFFIMGPIGIILFIFIFLGVPTKMMNDYQIYKDKKMNNYLQQEAALEQNSNQIINNIITSMQNGNLTVESTSLAISQIELYINEFSKVKRPAAFKEHSKAFESVLDEQLSLLRLVEVSLKTNSINNSQIQYYVQELNHKHVLKRNALIAAFDSEKIRYEILSDGSIRYWYKKDTFSID